MTGHYRLSSSRWHSTDLNLKTGRLTIESKRNGRNEISGIIESKKERKDVFIQHLWPTAGFSGKVPFCTTWPHTSATVRSWDMLRLC